MQTFIGDRDMIEIDGSLVERARSLAEDMAREGKDIAAMSVAENAELVVARNPSALSIILHSIPMDNGAPYYVGLLNGGPDAN